MAEVPDIARAPVSAAASRSGARWSGCARCWPRRSKPLAILGGSCWTRGGPGGDPRVPARQPPARRGRLPAAGALRRHRCANFVGDLGVGSDPALVAKAKEADLVLAIGTRLGEAVTQGYTLFDTAGGDADRPRLSRSRGDRPRLPPRARHRRRPQRLRRAAAATGAGAGPPGTAGRSRAARAARGSSGRCRTTRGAQSRPGHARAGEAAAAGRDLHLATPAISRPGRRASSTSPRTSASSARPTARWATACRPAIGAKIAFPGPQVVGFVGDGGFLMTGQEIATAFHHGVAPIVLVFNNQMYGTIRMYQERDLSRPRLRDRADQPGFRQVHRERSAAMARW